MLAVEAAGSFAVLIAAEGRARLYAKGRQRLERQVVRLSGQSGPLELLGDVVRSLQN